MHGNEKLFVLSEVTEEFSKIFSMNAKSKLWFSVEIVILYIYFVNVLLIFFENIKMECNYRPSSPFNGLVPLLLTYEDKKAFIES